MPLVDTNIEIRLEAVESRIRAAAQRSGRNRAAITLVAVSKKFSADHLMRAYQAGLRVFGENYVQEFADKKPQLAGMAEARYHLIGHLQSNKARAACELFDSIHTIDSVRLLHRVEAAAAEAGKQLEALVEVNVSGEAAKAGASLADLPAILHAAQMCGHVKLTGLMTMPPWSANAEDSRPYFQQLAKAAAAHRLMQLSMGMSNDLEVAIEEGATLVRVGTALFGARPKPAA